jgi:nicotinamide-nucleotide amidase
VGTVHFAVARENRPVFHQVMRHGDVGRSEVRRLTLVTALEMLRRTMT